MTDCRLSGAGIADMSLLTSTDSAASVLECATFTNMTEEQYSELLSLTRQNGQMLAEILSYVRKVDSPEYKEQRNSQDLLQNLVANAVIEQMFENRQNKNNRFFQ